MPVNPDLKSGKYELWLAVTTEAGEEVYSYPVTVTVINKNVKVSAVSENINLFYMLSANGNIMFTFNGDYIDAPTVNWTDDADKALGFNISKFVYYDNTKKNGALTWIPQSWKWKAKHRLPAPQPEPWN